MSERSQYLDCIDFVRMVSDHLERRLTSEEISLVEEHLNLCDGCGRYLEQMRQTIQIAGLLRGDEVADPIRPALIEAFRTWRRP